MLNDLSREILSRLLLSELLAAEENLKDHPCMTGRDQRKQCSAKLMTYYDQAGLMIREG